MDTSKMGNNLPGHGNTTHIATAHELQKAAEATKGKNPNMRTFYSRLDGCFYVFPDGKKIIFYGGEYETDIPEEIAHLEKLCKEAGQYLINAEPVPCRKSEAQLMKEIGGGGHNGTVIQGPVNSAGLIGMSPK